MTVPLGVTLVTVAVAVHVAAVIAAFGSAFANPVLVAAVKRTDRSALAALHRAQRTVARKVIGPSSALVLISGIYLAADEHVFAEAWVLVPLVTIVLLGALGGGVLARGYERLAELCDAGSAGEAEYAAVSRRVDAVALLITALVLLSVYVMVAKPG